MALLPLSDRATDWEAPPNMMLVGLGYRKASGKDTLAGFLRTEAVARGWTVTQLSFAEPIRAIMRLFGLTEEQLTTQAGKARVDPYWGVPPRALMQWVGTECFRRTLHPDIWVAVLLRQLVESPLAELSTLVLITDVRFPNEADAIRRWGGEVWRVDRAADALPHASEHALDDYEHWAAAVDNNGTLEDLRVAAAVCLADLLNRRGE